MANRLRTSPFQNIIIQLIRLLTRERANCSSLKIIAMISLIILLIKYIILNNKKPEVGVAHLSLHFIMGKFVFPVPFRSHI